MKGGQWCPPFNARQTSAMRPAVVCLAVALLVASCSSSSHASRKRSNSAQTTAPAPAAKAPVNATAAQLSGPVTGGAGHAYLGQASAPDLARAGYREDEYFAQGTATAYTSKMPLSNDGKWTVQPASTAPYKTRIVVRRPIDGTRFNGTVLVEWLNVSGGIDASPDFTYLGDEIMRSGYVWVGVSAQKIGVEGGQGVVAVAVAPKGGLKGIDAARYGSLHHPGDQYSQDIYTQAAAAVRSPGAVDPLGGLKLQRMIAVGESQSAFTLTTYVNAFQPMTHLFDGFYIHSRGGGAMPLDGGNIANGLSGSVHIRDDIDVPVFMLETETDEAFLHYFDARQPDTDKIRLWDIAGAAHADQYQVGNTASMLGCNFMINTAPTHYVLKAALVQLEKWVKDGTPPPTAPRMQVVETNGSPVVQRDAQGNALGGLRTPWIDVPAAAYSGAAPQGSSVLCSLFGQTNPFTTATLQQLYGSKASYVQKYTDAADRTIAAGFMLPADRAAIIAETNKVSF